MANPILIKRSSVAAKVPATTDLALGELAINTTDGKLFLKKDVAGTETIVQVGPLTTGDLAEGANLYFTDARAQSAVTSVTGNAGTATKLATARNINGVAFDGTANITISATADAGALTGTTLAAGVTASSLTSVGTLSSLTVSGGVSAGTIDWASYSVSGRGLVTSASSIKSILSASAAYGISTNADGGLDIMANQEGTDIRFYAGTANSMAPAALFTIADAGVVSAGKVTVGGAVVETKVVVAAANIDLSLASYYSKTITTTTAFTLSNVAAANSVSSFVLDLTNGGAGAITWWANVKWVGGTPPSLTLSGRDTLGFFTYDAGVTWTGLVLGKDIK